MVNYWIFTVVDARVGKSVIAAADLLRSRAKRGFWLFTSKSRHLGRVEEGDRAIFYVGGRRGGYIMGCCRVSLRPKPLPKEAQRYLMEDETGRFTHYVELKDPELWATPVGLDDLRGRLALGGGKHLGVCMQGSIIRIGAQDYEIILDLAGPLRGSVTMR